jgi:murein DD-endopeptidase MepM/ murein hydrolase activator NlpD
MMTLAQSVHPRLPARCRCWSTLAPWIGVIFTLGCKVVIEHADDSAKVGTQSDTTIVLPANLPETKPAPPSVQSSGDSTDSTPPEATSAQLETLSSELMIPLPGVQPSELRDTFHELRGGGTRMHEALDIMAPRGTPVLSAAPGRVLRLHNSKDGGLMVYAADSTKQFVLMYAHLDRYAPGLRDDMPLERGQLLGFVGTTGNAAPDAPHLHFAIAHPRDVKLWWTGTAIDPRPLLRRPAAVH